MYTLGCVSCVHFVLVVTLCDVFFESSTLWDVSVMCTLGCVSCVHFVTCQLCVLCDVFCESSALCGVSVVYTL